MTGVALVAGTLAWSLSTSEPTPAAPPSPEPASVTPQPVPTPAVAGLQDVVRAQVTGEHERVLALTRSPASTASELGEAYGALGKLLLAYNLGGAGVALTNARDLMPQDPRWPHYLGYLRWSEGRPQEAEAAYRRVLALAPGDVPARLRLGEALLEQGRYDEAGRLLEEAATRAPTSAQAAALLGRLAAAKADPETAVRHFEAALALSPESNMLYRPLAMAYRATGDVAKSAELLAQSGSVVVPWDDPLTMALADLKRGSNIQLLRAGVLLKRGQSKEAASIIATAVAGDPSNAMAHMDLAAARYQLGDLPGAVAAAQEAVRLAPAGGDASTVRRSLGYYLMESGQAAGAEGELKAALEILPTNARAHADLATLYRRTERCAAAIPHLETLLELEPATPLRRIELAMCRTRLGRHAEARATLEQSQALFPADRDLGDALARILATAPDGVEDAQRALVLAEAAHRRFQALDTLETLAMALAANGRFQDAAARQREAIALAVSDGRTEWQAFLEMHLRRYEAGRKAVEPWPEFLFRR